MALFTVTNGSTTFSGFNGIIRDLQFNITDDVIFVFGNFTGYNNQQTNGFVAVNQDGTGIASFFNNNTAGLVGENYDYRTGIAQSKKSGRLYLGGSYTEYNESGPPGITQLNIDNTRVATFDANLTTGFEGGKSFRPYWFENKLYCPSEATLYNGVATKGLFRTGENSGIYEDIPGITTGFTEGRVTSLHEITSIPKNLLCVGDFVKYNGTIQHGLMLLDVGTGAFNSFTSSGSNNLGPDKYHDVSECIDGIYFSGYFTEINGDSHGYITLLDNNGDVNPVWTNAGSGFNGPVPFISAMFNSTFVLASTLGTTYKDIPLNSKTVILKSTGDLVAEVDVPLGFVIERAMADKLENFWYAAMNNYTLGIGYIVKIGTDGGLSYL